MKNVKNETVVAAVKSTQGRMFGVEFMKADGSIRKMNCRIDVKKHLAGGVKTYDAKDSKDGDTTIGVFDVQSKGYRCFKASKVSSLIIDGNKIDFQ